MIQKSYTTKNINQKQMEVNKSIEKVYITEAQVDNGSIDQSCPGLVSHDECLSSCIHNYENFDTNMLDEVNVDVRDRLKELKADKKYENHLKLSQKQSQKQTNIPTHCDTIESSIVN